MPFYFSYYLIANILNNYQDKEEDVNGFKTKLFASEVAVDVSNKAKQVLGGHGYSRDYGIERLFRDARGLMLHFKTSEWLRQDFAKAVLGF